MRIVPSRTSQNYCTGIRKLTRKFVILCCLRGMRNFKGKVTQIEKTLINDRLRVSKAS